MASITQQYAELAALAQLYLQQEYPLQKRIYADAASYAYFRENALRDHSNTAQAMQPNLVPPRTAPTNFRPLKVLQPLDKNLDVKTLSSIQSLPPSPSTQEAPIAAAALTISISSEEPSQLESSAPLQTPMQTPDPLTPKQEKTVFVLAPPLSYEPVDVQDISKILINRHPSLKLLENTPSDALVTKGLKPPTSKLDIPEIILLSFDQSAQHIAFLENIRRAIQSNGNDAKIFDAVNMEKNKSWKALFTSEDLRLVVTSDSNMEAFPLLKTYFLDSSGRPQQTVCKARLFLLSPLSHYFKEPALKPLLWKAIREMIQTFSSSP